MTTKDNEKRARRRMLLLRLGVTIFLLDGVMYWQDHFKASADNFIALVMGGICVFWGLAIGNQSGV